jgi:hypothetical protein
MSSERAAKRTKRSKGFEGIEHWRPRASRRSLSLAQSLDYFLAFFLAADFLVLTGDFLAAFFFAAFGIWIYLPSSNASVRGGMPL